MSREQEILAALATATGDQRQALSAELARARVPRVARQVEPTIPVGGGIDYRMQTTAASDWLLRDEPKVDEGALHREASAAAHQWWSSVSDLVMSHTGELGIQARGAAAAFGVRFGAQAPVAMSSFMQRVAHLSQGKVAATPSTVHPETTDEAVPDYDDYFEEDRRARVRYEKGGARIAAEDWQNQQSDKGKYHEYVGSGERCRMCGFTKNHVLHTGSKLAADDDYMDVQVADFANTTQPFNQGEWTVDGVPVQAARHKELADDPPVGTWGWVSQEANEPASKKNHPVEDFMDSFVSKRGAHMASSYTATTPDYFIADMNRFNAALAPFVIDFGDGTQGIRPEAPEDLTRPYSTLLQMGYANGWLASKRASGYPIDYMEKPGHPFGSGQEFQPGPSSGVPRDLFPDGIPLHGDLTPEQEAWMKKRSRLAGGMFPGPNSTVYYNDAGEPMGWDDNTYDDDSSYDEYDDAHTPDYDPEEFQEDEDDPSTWGRDPRYHPTGKENDARDEDEGLSHDPSMYHSDRESQMGLEGSLRFAYDSDEEDAASESHARGEWHRKDSDSDDDSDDDDDDDDDDKDSKKEGSMRTSGLGGRTARRHQTTAASITDSQHVWTLNPDDEDWIGNFSDDALNEAHGFWSSDEGRNAQPNLPGYADSMITMLDAERARRTGSRRRLGSRRIAEGGQTCSTCGGSIERDPKGESNRTWHHNDGDSHDHEAKPGKQSRRRTAADSDPMYILRVTNTDRSLEEIQRYMYSPWKAEQVEDGTIFISGHDDGGGFGLRNQRDRLLSGLIGTEIWDGPDGGTMPPGRGVTWASRHTAARPIYEVAAEIKKVWGFNNINFAARPYLDAMMYLNTISDSYGADSGRGIIAYFLGNASQFRGPDAKRLKDELKVIQKGGARTASPVMPHPQYDTGYIPFSGPGRHEPRSQADIDADQDDDEYNPSDEYVDWMNTQGSRRQAKTPGVPDYYDTGSGLPIEITPGEATDDFGMGWINDDDNGEFADATNPNDDAGYEQRKDARRRTAGAAYNRGLKDGKLGDGIQYNPYPAFGSDASEWIRGYRDAQNLTPGQPADARTGNAQMGYSQDDFDEANVGVEPMEPNNSAAKTAGAEVVKGPDSALKSAPQNEQDAYWSWVGQGSADSDSGWYVPLDFEAWRLEYWDEDANNPTYHPGLPPMASSRSMRVTAADGDTSYCRLCGKQLQQMDYAWYALKASPLQRDVGPHNCVPARLQGRPGEFGPDGVLVPGTPGGEGGQYDAPVGTIFDGGGNAIHVGPRHYADEAQSGISDAPENEVGVGGYGNHAMFEADEFAPYGGPEGAADVEGTEYLKKAPKQREHWTFSNLSTSAAHNADTALFE